MKISEELLNLEPAGRGASGDCASISFAGNGYVCLLKQCELGDYLGAECDPYDDPHSRTLAQVETTALGIDDASSIISATLTFSLRSASHYENDVPQGRVSGFTSNGTLRYLPYKLKLSSDILVFGSQVFNAVVGTNIADITSMLKFHVASGEQCFGMYFAPVGKSIINSYNTEYDADTAKLCLNVDYDSSSGL
jgi:hypothetical protein